MTYEIKYRKDHEMKDSGVEWLGRVAENFYVKSLKYSYKFTTGATPSSGDESYYSEDGYKWLTISDMKSKHIKDTLSYISIKAIRETNIKLNKKGSLVYSFKLSVGQVAFLEDDMYTNEAIATFDISNKNSLNFLYYMAPIFIIKNANENIYGAKLLNQNLIKNAKILITELQYQQKIANFLDLKTSEFDSIISKKELLIEKLEEAKKSLISEVVTGKVKILDGELVERNPDEMKDSGVEWLGMIPKDWKAKRLKHYTIKAGSGKTPRGGSEIYLEEGIPFLRSQNIYNDGLRLDDVVYINDEINREMSNSVVVKGDILLNITGASIGRCCLYNLDINANVNQHVCIIRLKDKKTFNKLIELLIQSNIVQDYINSCQTGSSREGLNFEQIKNIAIPISKDHNEINNIVFNLNAKVTQLNSIITKTKLQIQKLKQAKQSLISEAVTGKIDLRDWIIQEI